MAEAPRFEGLKRRDMKFWDRFQWREYRWRLRLARTTSGRKVGTCWDRCWRAMQLMQTLTESAATGKRPPGTAARVYYLRCWVMQEMTGDQLYEVCTVWWTARRYYEMTGGEARVYWAELCKARDEIARLKQQLTRVRTLFPEATV